MPDTRISFKRFAQYPWRTRYLFLPETQNNLALDLPDGHIEVFAKH